MKTLRDAAGLYWSAWFPRKPKHHLIELRVLVDGCELVNVNSDFLYYWHKYAGLREDPEGWLDLLDGGFGRVDLGVDAAAVQRIELLVRPTKEARR